MCGREQVKLLIQLLNCFKLTYNKPIPFFDSLNNTQKGRPMHNILLKRVSILLSACVCISIISCTPVKTTVVTTGVTTGVTTTPSTLTPTFNDDPLSVSRESTVNAVLSLPSGHPGPNVNSGTQDLTRQTGWFDANDYFTVLNHLSMEPGYTLDYVYRADGSGAQPVLYARKIDARPFSTSSELAASFNNNSVHVDPSKAYQFDYLLHVQTDGTEESYFQYAALRILGGQFYLWWHAGYSVRPIICDRQGLESLFATTKPPFGPPEDIQNKARKLDFSPKVEVGKDTASVRVVTFNSWEGFIEQDITIQRAFPNIIRDYNTKALAAWHSTVMF
jgi:hypothetical protein